MDIPNIYKGLFSYHAVKGKKLETGEDVKLRELSSEIAEYLIKLNGERVKALVKNGEANEEVLLDELSDWSNYKGTMEKLITFVGIRITTNCNLVGRDKCVYCDQRLIKETTTFNDYKNFFDDLFKKSILNDFYFSISGGEPLLWGTKLYGENGLIRYLNAKGVYINMNSDLHLLNTDNCLDILSSGINSIRVSFDISDEYMFNEITTEGAFKRTLFSVFLIMKFKEIYNLSKPKLFFNVVGTKVNINYYGELIDFLIEFLNEHISDTNSESIKSLMNIHLIPLGGEKNKYLMPEKKDWEEFIYDTIPKTRKKWTDFMKENDIDLFDFDSFANPLNIDMYSNTIDEIIENFTEGHFNKNARRIKCYCSPTQMYILPNGDVYPCGIHAEHDDTFVLGNIKKNNISEIIDNNIDYLNKLPNNKCKKCPISTLKINIRVEEKLKNYINQLLINK